MSRHRNVRSMNYSDEYDGYDDEYGHSVEDDYCISPSDAAQFMYDRNRQSTQISAFFSEADNIAEEDEVENNVGSDRRVSDKFQKPRVSELEEVRLQSCLDEIKNVIGDTIPENIIVETILKNSFDLSKSLDAVLSYEPSTNKTDEPKPQRERRERNRDDDFSDSYAVLQNHLTRSKEQPLFSICSNGQKSLHYFPESRRLLLEHLVADSTDFSSKFSMNRNNLSKKFLVTVSEASGKFGSMRSIHQDINPFMSSGMFKVDSESLGEGTKPNNSSSAKQLKFQIPRLQKIRKDSDKENIAEGDECDSDEISFSSLTALAKQYSSKNYEASLGKVSDSLQLTQSDISDNVLVPQSVIESERYETNCEEFARISESSHCVNPLVEDLLICKHHFRHSEDEEKHSPDDRKELFEDRMSVIFKRLSTQSEIQSAETSEMSSVLRLPQDEERQEFPMSSIVPSLRKVKSNDKTTLSHEKKDFPSLSEILKDHLHKSVSYNRNLHAASNYDIMKSESCPQFIIPQLHLSQKRRGVSESSPDTGQNEKVWSNSADVTMTDEDSETENWIIDLKCALKTVQKESIVNDSVIDSPTQVKSCHVDPSTQDHLFIPDLPCLLDASLNLKEKCSLSRRHPSAFGKVLCRKWKVHHVKVHYQRELPEPIARFTFSTPSPDDNVQKFLKWK